MEDTVRGGRSGQSGCSKERSKGPHGDAYVAMVRRRELRCRPGCFRRAFIPRRCQAPRERADVAGDGRSLRHNSVLVSSTMQTSMFGSPSRERRRNRRVKPASTQERSCCRALPKAVRRCRLLLIIRSCSLSASAGVSESVELLTSDALSLDLNVCCINSNYRFAR